MITLLAFDTATVACTVGLLVGEEVIEDHRIIPSAHNEQLLPMMQGLLDQASLRWKDLTAIAFGQGPGSFTGLRIAASVAQGLGFSLNVPLIPLSTLHIMAQGAYRKVHAADALVAWDARLSEVYWGQYRYDQEAGIMLPTQEDALSSPNTVPLIQREGVCRVGNGWEVYAEALKVACGRRVGDPVYHNSYPHGHDSVVLARYYWENHQTVLPEHVRPLYLRTAAPAVG